MIVFAGAVSQTPRPLARMIVTTTAANRRSPASAVMKPRTSSGTLLDATCSQPLCRNAAGTTSRSSESSRGLMPYVSRAWPEAVSMPSRIHRRATQPAIRSPAVRARALPVVPLSAVRSVVQ